ncbi:hypothetical protein HYX04_05065 [Candidatus Woesearchaeota archaeon]|nr:hypothetical protein [Candidatus Woesearchaeota archaeon]
MVLSNDNLRYYMARAIKLAKQFPFGIGRPLVGAVVVSESGILVGEGCKTLLDGTNITVHAERVALDNAEGFTNRGYLITTLEPCVKTHKNAIFRPCAELAVEKGIHTVVIGIIDDSPAFNGTRGVEYLRGHSVEVVIYDYFNSKIREELMLRK